MTTGISCGARASVALRAPTKPRARSWPGPTVVADAGEALATIQRLAARRGVLFTWHSVWRMDERRVARRDVFRAIAVATVCAWDHANESWTIRSVDVDGHELALAVVIDGLLVIKTVF